MAEMATETPRLAPFGAILTPGRYGAKGPDGPAVTLGLRHPLSIVAIMVRKGRAEALAAAMRDGFGLAPPGPGQSAAAQDLVLRWAGPEQWFAIAEGGRDASGDEDVLGRLAIYQGGLPWAEGVVRSGYVSTGF